MKTNEIRNAFLNYFKDHGHTIVPSSSLVPTNDLTLLFTNAGMVQFKQTFLGTEERPYVRATSSQRCVRAGGKHNDLENVGYTRRHHTFFEMLGNFSFGDYFKREAIRYAWDFLTETLGLPAEKLWVTVYEDDQESEDIWLKEMKIDPKRFSRCGEKDNFWSMGETGPCGPCTEIFYDHGPEVEGGPPGTPEEDGDRYVEIWNLVFMQYNRDNKGNLELLPKPCVDTGMGLERIAAVMQGVHNNYDIDLFKYLLQEIAKLIDYKDTHDTSMRVIADHIRSCAFLIVDGVLPSNEGRGYVLRRIIRRAIRHGHKLGQREPFFSKLTRALVDVMGEAYPELEKTQRLIEQVLLQEEEQFENTLSNGMKIFDHEVASMSSSEIPGDFVFILYDTYGFPPDLTADIARERGMTIDYVGFEKEMNEQRARSQQAQRFGVDYSKQIKITGETEFTGYERLTDRSKVMTLVHNDEKVEQLELGQKGIVILDRTPFYAEAGGQVGDAGFLNAKTGCFRVHDTQKQGRVYFHYGEMLEGSLHINESVQAVVDEVRQDIILNHSATHLLHEALRRVLGEHVVQKGSLVEAKRLRFDFSHSKPLSREEVQSVERLVNQQIRANLPSKVTVSSLDEAKKMGALALFGEKYEAEVRVVAMGDFSTELCGGTHAERSGDIGFFKIISETAVAAGMRRLEAVTGRVAVEWAEKSDAQLSSVATLLKVKSDEVTGKLHYVLEQNRELTKEITRLKRQLSSQESGSLIDQVVEVKDLKVLAEELKSADRDTLRSTVDQMKQKLGERAAVILASVQDQKVMIVAGVSKDLTAIIKAPDLLNHVAKQIGGKGGGRPDMAQGGGEDPRALRAALDSVPQWIEQQLK